MATPRAKDAAPDGADRTPPDNKRIAAALIEAASLLQAQGANRFRIAAYRRAAQTLLADAPDVRELFERSGIDGLDTLPGVGRGIAAAIAELLTSGRWATLEALRGGDDPVERLRTVPGVGRELARRLHEKLDIDTLPELEIAARDGRLQRVNGVGERRALSIGASVSQLLDRLRPRPHPDAMPSQPPPVSLLLDIDQRYRRRAGAGRLPLIAPKRFNPSGEAWLPVLHERAGDWHATALYSNTARAYELGRVHDWVVVYVAEGDHAEQRFTVVTETWGVLAGCRVVRGREAECRDWHAQLTGATPPATKADSELQRS